MLLPQALCSVSVSEPDSLRSLAHVFMLELLPVDSNSHVHSRNVFRCVEKTVLFLEKQANTT
jgi:hypothetical protein